MIYNIADHRKLTILTKTELGRLGLIFCLKEYVSLAVSHDYFKVLEYFASLSPHQATDFLTVEVSVVSVPVRST